MAYFPGWAKVAIATSIMATGPHDGLVIDNFAGAGGASIGIEEAIGRPIDIALNHDREAIATHQANHPNTIHICQDIMKVDPRDVVQGRPVWLAWFSPDCKHHSKAKGGKPKEKKIRDLAWVVVLWARRVQPTIIMLENVEEFRKWGPLDDDGNPIKERMGETWEKWLKELRRCGYKIEFRERRASNFGVATIRKRLFLVARRDGGTITWPAETHGKPQAPAVLRGLLQPYRTAAECIDWSIPAPSIFERKKELAEATMRRIAYGVFRYVINCADPFIVPILNTNWGGDRVDSIREPFKTMTASKGGQWALAVPHLVHTAHGDKTKEGRPRGRGTLSVEEPLPTTLGKGSVALATPLLIGAGGAAYGGKPRSGGEPFGTILTHDRKALVTAFLDQHNFEGRSRPVTDPMATLTERHTHHKIIVAHMEQANTGVIGHDAREPLSTIVEKGCTQRLIGSTLLRLNNSEGRNNPGAYSMEEPLGTIAAEGKHYGAVYAFLTKYYSTGGQWQDLRDPLHTAPARDSFALVMVHGELYAIADIGMRMLEVPELAAAQGFPRGYNFAPIVDGRPLPKTYQVRQIGNSVCPEMARTLVAANRNTPAEPVEEERDAA